MRKLFLLIIVCFAGQAFAACGGASPTWTAASTSATDVQACFNAALQCGDTINIPAGSSSWGVGLTLSPHTGCPAFTGSNAPSLTVQGQNTCQFGCNAGSGGISGTGTVNTVGTAVTFVSGTNFNTGWTGKIYIQGKSFTISTVNSGTSITLTGSAGTHSGVPYVVPMIVTDNTTITLAAAGTQTLNITGTSDTAAVVFSSMTITPNSGYSNGLIQIIGTARKVSYRVHHIHIVSPNSDPRLFAYVAVYGVQDHILYTDSSAGPPTSPAQMLGDFSSTGFSDWVAATGAGTSACDYIEDSFFFFNTNNSEGVFDAYTGAKVCLRYSYVIGSFLGGGHGYDSTPSRGVVNQEMYNLTADNPNASNMIIANWRSGTGIFANNTLLNSGGGGWTGIPLALYRNSSPTDVANLGTVCAGCNWIVIGVNGTSNTLGPPSAYQTVHAYSAHSAVLLAASCNVWTNAGGTTGGSAPACPGTGNNVTDSGGVVWLGIGGSISSGTEKWCAVNPDTQCTADATCNALSGGDTCSRFVDNTNGTVPFRDQPGYAHNQVSTPIYAWNNTIAGLSGNLFATSGSDAPFIVSGTNYFPNTASPSWTQFTYPHPFQGTPPPPQVSTPFATPAGGTYAGTQSVVIATATGGATLCYTIDGTTPTANGAGTCTHGTTYTTAVSVAVSLTLKSVGSLAGDTDSVVDTEVYVITAPPTPGASGTGLTALGVVAN